jgi:hypothetical protein
VRKHRIWTTGENGRHELTVSRQLWMPNGIDALVNGMQSPCPYSASNSLGTQPNFLKLRQRNDPMLPLRYTSDPFIPKRGPTGRIRCA